MNLELNGKSVLITGASKGIGEATAEAFAREGSSAIHVTARSSDLLDKLGPGFSRRTIAKSIPTHWI